MKSTFANRGASLEKAVEASAGNLLTLVKVPNGVKYKAGGGTFPVPSPVDFMGIIKGTGGRGICFDAKKCALVKAFPIGNRDHFPAHQREFLIRMGEAGAVSGLLVESAAEQSFLWLPWHTVMRAPASIQWDSPWWYDLGPNTHAIKFANIPGVSPQSPGLILPPIIIAAHGAEGTAHHG